MTFRFGEFEVLSQDYLLLRNGQPIHLEPRVFEVLAYLCQHHGRLVPKKELLEALWPHEYVTESALSRTIRDLRRVLGDSGRERRWIDTVYGRGFHFCGELGTGEPPSPSPRDVQAGPLLLERDAELRQMERLLAEAAAAGRLALIGGEAGIGKTALMEAFSGRVASALTAWGSCDALFTPIPFGPVLDVARELKGRLHQSISTGEPRHQILSATIDALETAPKPALVVIEDLHWADEATLDWFRSVARRLPRLKGVLLLASYRDNELSSTHPLRAVLGELPPGSTRRMFLSPLSRDAVGMMAYLAKRPAKGLWEATGGNPFFVKELLAAPAGALPATVCDAVLARASRLSPAARRVLGIVSVVPSRIERHLLDAVAGEALGGLGECLDAAILTAGEDGVRFAHELARRAIEQSLHVPERQQIHAAVLAALHGMDSAAGRFARLAYHAEQGGDPAAILELAPAAAAEAARAGAHREAVAHYAAVLKHGDTLQPAQRAEYLHRQAEQHFLADEYQACRDAQQRALARWRELGDAVRVGQSLLRLSRVYEFNAESEQAWELGLAAVEALEPVRADRELAIAYAHLAQLRLETWTLAEARDWAAKGTAAAERCGDVEALAHCLSTAGTARVRLGDEDGRALVERSIALAKEHDLEEHYARANACLLESYLYLRRYAEAEPFVTESLDFARRRDSQACIHYYLGLRARSRLEQGEWSAAADDAVAALDHPRVHAVSRAGALAILGRLRLRHGDPGWRPALEEAWKLALGAAKPHRLALIAAGWAEANWLRGSAAPAQPIVARALELVGPTAEPWALGEIAYWAWKAGLDVPEAPAVAEPFALQIAGQWQDAAKRWRRLGCPYEAALALTEGGARTARREGLAQLDALGAAPALAAITKET